uniref:Uncharacterized protein n=1 Tax=Tetranychus urticae TaxID=32264 RepID=T1KR73_TETUR
MVLAHLLVGIIKPTVMQLMFTITIKITSKSHFQH